MGVLRRFCRHFALLAIVLLTDSTCRDSLCAALPTKQQSVIGETTSDDPTGGDLDNSYEIYEGKWLRKDELPLSDQASDYNDYDDDEDDDDDESSDSQFLFLPPQENHLLLLDDDDDDDQSNEIKVRHTGKGPLSSTMEDDDSLNRAVEITFDDEDDDDDEEEDENLNIVAHNKRKNENDIELTEEESFPPNIIEDVEEDSSVDGEEEDEDDAFEDTDEKVYGDRAVFFY